MTLGRFDRRPYVGRTQDRIGPRYHVPCLVQALRGDDQVPQLAAEQPLGPARAVAIVRQIAVALDAHDNLRAVLERCVAEGDLEHALLLAADLSFFWFVHSHFGEAAAWYERLLTERGRVSPRARIKLLLGAGDCLSYTGDLAGAAHRN